MKIAFLGLGNMGTPMARHLLRAEHEVTVWNRTIEKAEVLEADGARVARSVAEAAIGVEMIITMLADDHAVRASVLHSNMVVDNLPKGATHISMSTISVALSRKLADTHAERGHRYMAAPVFGRPDAAADGKLFVAAAGDPKVVEHCRPVLESLGQKVFVLGNKPEMANVVKLSGNFLIAAVIESLGEAITLARKYDIDPQAYVDFLTGSLFAAPVYKTYGGLIAGEKYTPAGFKMRLGLKDVRLALSAAESVDTPLPIASLIRDHMLTALGRGMENMDWSAVAKLAAENAGL